MDKKTIGAWLVYQTGKLQRVDSQTSFETTYLAGKTAILLSAISSDTEAVLPDAKVIALARAAGINTRTELPVILDTLKRRELIEVTPGEIAVLGVNTGATLTHAADIFDDLNPTSTERAAIALCEEVSNRPMAKHDLLQVMSDSFRLSTPDCQALFVDCEQIGFVDVEQLDSNLAIYFNGNLFRRDDATKVARALDGLTAEERTKVVEFSDMLSRRACIPLSQAERILGAGLFTKLSAIGMYDMNVVSNQREEVTYVTRPSAFRKYTHSMVEDAFDFAKMFISSLTYGMTRSPYARGQIRMVEALMSALIAGQPVGPVQAIGEDYKVLEMRNVIQVYCGSKKGRTGFMMRLLKKEVGVLALEVIRSADASEHSLTELPGAAITRFSGPELNRERRRRSQVHSSPKATNNILTALRTGVR